MRRITNVLSLAVVAAFAQAAAAQATATTPASSASGTTAASSTQPSSERGQTGIIPPSVVGETLVVRGTVDKIDPNRRLATLKGEDGRVVTMRIGPEIRNFENLKIGDTVTATFTEAVVLALAEGADSSGIRTRVEAEAARQSAAGAKPGVRAVERTTIVANVTDVDRSTGKVTLRGPSGDTVTLKVQDKQALQALDKGDQVVASLVEAAAVSIEAGAPSGSKAATGSSATASSAPAVGSSRPDYSKPMDELLRAAQNLREAVQAMATQPAGPRRNQAMKQANEALLETQRAMVQLPPELRNESSAVSGKQYDESMEKLQQAAQQLRESIQAMATQPTGSKRSEATRQAHEALLETQQAMLAVLAADSAR